MSLFSKIKVSTFGSKGDILTLLINFAEKGHYSVARTLINFLLTADSKNPILFLLKIWTKNLQNKSKSMIYKGKNKPFWILAILAALYVLLAIIGGIKTYSPIPFWDMWEGYLDFFMRAQEGDLSIWWSQHNEHRIFLSRILFWVDIYFFKGLSIFLIFFNFLLGGLIFYCFFHILKKALPSEDRQLLRHWLSLFILALTFSWTQSQNYAWAFQSQFFLAYLLPLAGFYCLYLSSNRGKNARFAFLFSCLSGLGSVVSMANGVAALPIMTILAFFLKLGWRKITLLGILSSLVLLSFICYNTSVPDHASLKNSLFNHPIEFARFILIFFGNPFYWISWKMISIATLAGVFFIYNALYLFYRFFKKNQSSLIQWVLFAFIFYIGVTAIGLAGVRLGISHPTDSRYMTPSLMAWEALLILYVLNSQKTSQYKICSILILILLFPWQIRTLFSNKNYFEQEIAILALKMEIKDQKQISFVHPRTHIINIAKKAFENRLSIFETPRFKSISPILIHRVIQNLSSGNVGTSDLQPAKPFAKQGMCKHMLDAASCKDEDADDANGQILNHDVYRQIEPASSTSVQCTGNLEELSSIEDELSYVKIKGWLFDPNTQKVPSVISILDQDKKIIGYALTGQLRKDIKKIINPNALHSGFSGYMLAEYVGKEVTVQGVMPNCHITIVAQ